MTTPADTHARALAINLDSSIYGSFAEIGAGQEVARWFFRVGGAAGTVARTISAYDMAMSDAVYGKADRYVSRARLEAMLEREHALLLEQLGPTRGDTSRFFAFADTVSARNYAGTNECHGWVGLRFQHEPRAAASEALLHVNLMDSSNLAQQVAVGILGVNLVHGAYHERATPQAFLAGLATGLSLARLEVDVAELRGPAFAGFDATAVALGLVRQDLANAVVFGPGGAVAPPSELLRKRPLVLERGRYRTRKTQHGPLLAGAVRHLRAELGPQAREPLGLFELSLRAPDGAPIEDDGLTAERVARLTALGFPVAVTRFTRAWEVTEFVRRYTPESVRFALGVSSLVEILIAQASPEQVGGGLQGLGRLLAEHGRFYVYPMPAAVFRERLARAGIDASTIGFDAHGTVGADGLRLPSPLGHLYAYLLAAGWVVPLPAPPESEPAAERSPGAALARAQPAREGQA